MAGTQDELIRAVHDTHAPALWAHCVRLTGSDRARAQDVCQETLLRAWRHPEVLEQPEPAVRSWLFTVARNLVIDEWRLRRNRREQVTADVPEPREPRASARPDEIDRLLTSWVVAEALDRLSVEHRRVVVESYYRGRSVAETARLLDVPEGTVKSRLHYALRALRLALEEMGALS